MPVPFTYLFALDYLNLCGKSNCIDLLILCLKSPPRLRFGLLTCMNLLLLVSTFLTLHTGLGSLKTAPLSWNWESACLRCGKKTKSPRGLFCNNFGTKRGNFKVCRRSWCSKCYVPSPSLVFHVADATTDAGAVWKRKKDDGRFMYARDGDMWSVPFQCECCWIVNIKGREFDPFDAKDLLLQQYLVRMNLDLMWSREPGTVKATLYQLEKGARLSEELGLDPVEISRGPWPLTDNVGCQVALQILRASQGKGKHSSEYQQFETIRKLRSGYSNAFESSPSGAIQGNVVFRAERARTYGLRACPTESIFFDRFMQGLLSRMGRVIIPDEAIDNIHMHGIIRLMNDEIHLDETTWVRKREIIMQGAYFMLCYGCSLRGYEGLYLESSDFTNFIDTGKDGVVEADGTERCEGHVCAPLLGRFKNEAGEQKHVMVMVNESSSGLRFRLWMERLAYVLKREGKNKVAGPAFCHEDGSMIMSYEMNEALLFWLEKLKFEKPRSFPEGADLGALYGVNRSFRRGANSRATEQGVGKDLRDLINRWSTFESKKGQRPNMSMAQHYLEIKLVIKRTLKYSKAL